jgi:phosphatidylglycerol:prolipoprotein diacylglycerol transferase
MHPILFEIPTSFGKLPFPVYGLMLTLGVLAASLIGHYRSSRIGLNPDRMAVIYLICVTSGVAGARLLHFMMAADSSEFWHNPLIYFNPGKGGLAIYGGLIGGFFAVMAYCYRKGMSFWKVADVMGPAVIVGLAFGRIGCFFAGCCHGKSCELPVDASTLYEGSGGHIWLSSHFPYMLVQTAHGVGVNGVPVYPTQLWEHLAAMVIFLISSVSFRYRKFDGQAIATVMLLYGLWRPINESMRGDDIRGLYFGVLTTSQLISIPVVLGALLLIATRWNKGVAPEVEYQPFKANEDLGPAPRL